MRRHEVLRTTFKMVQGEPVQVIAAAAPVPLPEVDLSELRAPNQEAEVQRLAQEEAGHTIRSQSWSAVAAEAAARSHE